MRDWIAIYGCRLGKWGFQTESKVQSRCGWDDVFGFVSKCGCFVKKELSRSVFQGMLPALMEKVNLGIIGSGTVGGGVYQAIQRNGLLMASRLGVQLRVAKVAVRDLKKARAVK